MKGRPLPPTSHGAVPFEDIPYAQVRNIAVVNETKATFMSPDEDFNVAEFTFVLMLVLMVGATLYAKSEYQLDVFESSSLFGSQPPPAPEPSAFTLLGILRKIFDVRYD